MPLSNYAKQRVVEWLIAKSGNSYNSYFYAALNTKKSTAKEAGAEVNASWYKRTILSVYSSGGVSDNKMSPVNVVDGVAETHNTVPVMFYKNTGEKVTVESITFYNQPSDGSYLGYCNLATPLVIEPGEIANFDVGELKLTLSEANETPVA